MEATLAAHLGSAAEARWMVEEVCGRHGADVQVGEAALHRLEEMARERIGGTPLQYVLGSWSFRTLELGVDRRALIPRPETEQVVEVALAELRDGDDRELVLVDLGTGTGAIALSLAVELWPRRQGLEVWATDADGDALALAAENLERVRATRPEAARAVRLAHGCWYEALPAELQGRVSLVVSNPPYVDDGQWEQLDAEVRQEPRLALVSPTGSDGTPGLAAIEAVVTGAARWLGPGGVLVVEISPEQADAALALADDAGLPGARIARDLSGRDRALVARR